MLEHYLQQHYPRNECEMDLFRLFRKIEEPIEPEEKQRASEARVNLLQQVMKYQRTADDVKTELARVTLEKAAKG